MAAGGWRRMWLRPRCLGRVHLHMHVALKPILPARFSLAPHSFLLLQVAYMYLDGMSGHGEEGSTHKTHTGSAEKCWARQMDVGQTVLARR